MLGLGGTLEGAIGVYPGACPRVGGEDNGGDSEMWPFADGGVGARSSAGVPTRSGEAVSPVGSAEVRGRRQWVVGWPELGSHCSVPEEFSAPLRKVLRDLWRSGVCGWNG